MTSLPYWTQALDPYATRWVRHGVHAILHSHDDQRLAPDAIVITDDHLVEAVAQALLGVRRKRAGADSRDRPLELPLKYRGPVAVDLLGFDAQELVGNWVEAIDGQRRGESVPVYELVPPRFERELVRTTVAAVQR
jgi:hypothetical protein